MIPHSRPHVDEREIEAVVQALQAGHLSQGEEVQRLERELSAMYDGAEAVVVSSGTAALSLALVALGVQKGKKVIIPSYTCRNLYAAVSYAGGTCLCADTGPDSVCITTTTVKPLLARHASRVDDTVAAIIVPHMFGYTADIAAILALGYPVIEDCAQSVGGVYADHKRSLLGSKGQIAILSFYATKLLSAGEGGGCITRDKGLAETIRSLRNCDEGKLNSKAFNFKMADVNAALARAKLQSLARTIEERERLAQRYDLAFGAKSFRKKSAQPQAVCFRYLVDLPRASRGTDKEINSFLKHSASSGIVCRRPVWRPLHYDLGGDCPRTEQLQETLVSVPLYPDLAEDEVEKICTTLPTMRSAW